MERSSCTATYFYRAFFSARLPEGRSRLECLRTLPPSGTCPNSHCKRVISALCRIQASLAEFYIFTSSSLILGRGERLQISLLQGMFLMFLKMELCQSILRPNDHEDVQECPGTHRRQSEGTMDRAWQLSWPVLWLANIEGFTHSPCAPRSVTSDSVCNAVVPKQGIATTQPGHLVREAFSERGLKMWNILPGVTQSLRSKSCFISSKIFEFITWPWEW